MTKGARRHGHDISEIALQAATSTGPRPAEYTGPGERGTHRECRGLLRGDFGSGQISQIGPQPALGAIRRLTPPARLTRSRVTPAPGRNRPSAASPGL